MCNFTLPVIIISVLSLSAAYRCYGWRSPLKLSTLCEQLCNNGKSHQTSSFPNFKLFLNSFHHKRAIYSTEFIKAMIVVLAVQSSTSTLFTMLFCS